MTERMIVRADGSPGMGLGHLLRTVALAEAARRRGWSVEYRTRTDAVAEELLSRRGLAWGWADPWSADIGEGDVVVVDLPHVGDDELRAATDRGGFVVLVDDHHEGQRPVSLVVAADRDETPRDGRGAPVLAGWRHALIRDEFAPPDRRRPGAPLLLVTFGGSDPTGAGQAFVDRVPPPSAFGRVVLLEGPASAPLERVPTAFEVVRDPADVAGLYRQADVAVTAGGTGALELATCGVAMAVCAVVDDQRAAVRRLESAGAAIAVQHPGLDDGVSCRDALARLASGTERAELRDRATVMVDGRGADRVLAEIDALRGRRAHP